ncbi:MAG: hypothetical protein FJX52_02115 [Alphaproteobacteria bacterium]|nr:hypothetical protein [Alphaproteobacteria bacterium]
MKVYDCFGFNNEFDILDLRLAELDPVVDRFVLVESRESFSGLPKPLHFAQARHRYAAFNDRIIHVELDELPRTDDLWIRENFQREAISRGLPALSDHDIVIVSDVDEIPRRTAVEQIRDMSGLAIHGLRMPHFNLRLNYAQIIGTDAYFVFPMAANGRAFARLGPQGMRNLRISLNRAHRAKRVPADMRVLPHAGWHFSYMGDTDHVKLKLQSFAHRELSHSEALVTYTVDEAVRRRLDLFGRPNHRWEVLSINEYFPRTLVHNLSDYRHLIAPNPSHAIDLELTRQHDGLVIVKTPRRSP